MRLISLVSRQKCKEYERTIRMEEADGAKLVQSISEKMAEMFRRKAQAARVGMSVQYQFCLYRWKGQNTGRILLNPDVSQ